MSITTTSTTGAKPDVRITREGWDYRVERDGAILGWVGKMPLDFWYVNCQPEGCMCHLREFATRREAVAYLVNWMIEP